MPSKVSTRNNSLVWFHCTAVRERREPRTSGKGAGISGGRRGGGPREELEGASKNREVGKPKSDQRTSDIAQQHNNYYRREQKIVTALGGGGIIRIRRLERASPCPEMAVTFPCGGGR